MKNKYSRDSIIVFVLTTSASAVNYLCQIIMGRTLSLESFGIINAIFSFILIAGVPGTTLNLLTVKYTAEQPENLARAGNIIYSMLRAVVFISVILLIGVLLALPAMFRILGTDDLVIVLLTSFLVCLNYPSAIYSGTLSGLKKFVWVGFISLILPFFKIIGVLGTFFVNENRIQLIIVLCPMLIGYGFLLFAGMLITKKSGIRVCKNKADELRLSLGHVGILTFLCNLLFIFFSNFDVLAINTLFGSKESGLYSSTMLFGRIIFYFVTSLATVMLPYVSSAQVDKSSPKEILKKTLLYTFFLVIVCIVPINLFPKFFLNLIYGNQYLEAAKYVPYASLISVLVSLLNIAMTYLIGIGRVKSLLVTLAAGLFSGLCILYFYHSQSEHVLLLISCVLTVLVLLNIRNCFLSDYRKDNYV